jgi:acid phosphatase type 7
VTLRGLAPSTRYEYRIAGGDIHATRTAPAASAPFEAVFLADTGMIGREDGLGTGVEQVIAEIGKMDPLVVLLGGDYAYYNTDKRWGTLDKTILAWFEQMKPIAVKGPMMPTYGNHEIFLREGYLFWAGHFPTPEGFDNRRYYSFDVADAHFVSILAADSERGPLAQSALEWIDRDMAAARRAGRKWIIPFLHVAPFSDGSNHPSNEDLRRQLGPLFEKHNVKIALACHDQSYERTYPLRGVPHDITATSKAKDCYSPNDGVTYLKVSPGGKISNINKSFATFKTNPPPHWTAFRDNTHHHFAKLIISAEELRIEVYGVKGDGSPPVVQDLFRYSGSCAK